MLVATDIASKGLDFPNIQHVINYDMPADIENYGMYCVFTCITLDVAPYLCVYMYVHIHCSQYIVLEELVGVARLALLQHLSTNSVVRHHCLCLPKFITPALQRSLYCET